jgi:hypothetical protein
MEFRQAFTRTVLAAAVAAVLVSAMFAVAASPASAHQLDVNPPGQETKSKGAVSTDWAQAHCNAQSPEVLASRGAATFTPQGALPCPPEANPGGQVHPHVDS